MKKCIMGLMLATFSLVAHAQNIPQLGQATIAEVVKAMTLEEKVHLLIGTGMDGIINDQPVIGETKNIVPGAAGTTYAIPRLGIPAVVLADGPAGVRISPKRENDTATYYCTHFPIATSLASTWNTELVQSVGQAIGNEALEYGVDILLAPALNIQRYPLCGRNFEYYSEDPVVSGNMATAYVKGVQNNGVGVSVKHFAANNQESNRTGNDARVSQRALREIYLKGFETVIKNAAPWTVMTSYNLLNGIYTSENGELLTDLLRQEWGFKGLVMSDWFGGKNAVRQMQAGNDMLQPGTEKQYNDIISAVKKGELDEKIIDRNVSNVLGMIVRTPHFKKYAYSNHPDLKSHADIARQAGQEGMVLLENRNNTLPLSQTSVHKIALLGSASYSLTPGGSGSGDVHSAYMVSLAEGLKNAGYEIDAETEQLYGKHIEELDEKYQDSLKQIKKLMFMSQPAPSEITMSQEILNRLSNETDIAILTVGRKSGEGKDCIPSDFNLSVDERQLIENTCRTFHAANKKVLVLLNVGNVIETASWKDLPDAILLAWECGQEMGNSIVDVLSGKVSPSGKLTMTFPVKLEDIPSTTNFPMGEHQIDNPTDDSSGFGKNWDYTDYEEDIYVGYRYFDTFKKDVSYPFGYGLSYTTFTYSSPRIVDNGRNYNVSINVTNIGDKAGKEIVQLYVSSPLNPAYEKPQRELKAFSKTRMLQPGETEAISMIIPHEALASFNQDISAWQTDKGIYSFLFGSSSRDIRLTKELRIGKQNTVPVGNILRPKTQISVFSK
ncbi:glycoside hydrolase family 3 N-terminal domain-containing protein [Mangrovibacterium marinum]|nr:glycoside hydrolase family 3 N-terminal domain-containing protein [Mangrovibacterium marinum]